MKNLVSKTKNKKRVKMWKTIDSTVHIPSLFTAIRRQTDRIWVRRQLSPVFLHRSMKNGFHPRLQLLKILRLVPRPTHIIHLKRLFSHYRADWQPDYTPPLILHDQQIRRMCLPSFSRRRSRRERGRPLTLRVQLPNGVHLRDRVKEVRDVGGGGAGEELGRRLFQSLMSLWNGY